MGLSQPPRRFSFSWDVKKNIYLRLDEVKSGAAVPPLSYTSSWRRGYLHSGLSTQANYTDRAIAAYRRS
jgi:hypothetical protein